MDINTMEDSHPLRRDGSSFNLQQNCRWPSRGALLTTLIGAIGFVAFAMAGLNRPSEVQTGRASFNFVIPSSITQGSSTMSEACPSGSPSGGFKIEVFIFESLESMPNLQEMTPDQTLVVPKLWYPLGAQAWDGFSVSENFALRVEGYLVVKASGSYKFKLGSDDASILFIDYELVINSSDGPSFQVDTGEIYLTAGVHMIQVSGTLQHPGAQALAQATSLYVWTRFELSPGDDDNDDDE